jgi:hypothetical protein
MAVVVKVPGNPGQEIEQNHPDGGDIDVKDGNLIVSTAGRTRTVAIYALGKWERAEITK